MRLLLLLLSLSIAYQIPWQSPPSDSLGLPHYSAPLLEQAIEQQEVTADHFSRLKPGEIPDYVYDHAPLVHLYSEERYLPYDVAQFVTHMTLQDAFGEQVSPPLTLPLLANYTGNSNLYMTSMEDYTTDPDWLTGKHNRPSYETGEIKDAPAILIVVDKGNGWVDAFWFYFYSFNLGPFVMGRGPYGNHVGDWEHSLVRFHNGKPKFVWMSAHGGGGGYTYEAVEKDGEFETGVPGIRPVIFSARGTHANYVSAGQHAHDLPYSILCDFTDRGPLWDPAKNVLSYTWDGTTLSPALNKSAEGDSVYNTREAEYGPWLLFTGHWGDPMLNPNDPRQVWSPWEYKYIDGPRGPIVKNLMREKICQRAKWWNFWKGCSVKKHRDSGAGFEGEGVNGCVILLGRLENPFLRRVVSFLAKGGWLCYVIDGLWG